MSFAASIVNSRKHVVEGLTINRKVEAEGGGLLDASRAAAEAGLPCVTGVKPSLAEPFRNYAGSYSQWIEASEAELERWWACHVRR